MIGGHTEQRGFSGLMKIDSNYGLASLGCGVSKLALHADCKRDDKYYRI